MSGWLFTKRGKLVAFVVDPPADNERAVRERDERLGRVRRKFPNAKEQYQRATK